MAEDGGQTSETGGRTLSISDCQLETRSNSIIGDVCEVPFGSALMLHLFIYLFFPLFNF